MRTEEKERCGVWSGMYECNCGWEEGKRGEDIEDGMRRHRPLSTLRADSTILAACSRRRVCDEGSALGATSRTGVRSYSESKVSREEWRVSTRVHICSNFKVAFRDQQSRLVEDFDSHLLNDGEMSVFEALVAVRDRDPAKQSETAQLDHRHKPQKFCLVLRRIVPRATLFKSQNRVGRLALRIIMTTTATELRAQLAKIEGETAALQSKLQLLSEQRRLPSDVTAEIFMHYLRNFPVIITGKRPASAQSGVGSLWLFHLWATLTLKWDRKTVNSREQLLKCWLLRAGGCLLDLDLSGSDLTKSKSISTVIVQHAPQLRKLAFTLPNSASDILSATSQAQLCFPALQTLTVYFSRFFDETITAFSDAPRLREVCISMGRTSFITLRWNQLTILDLNNSGVASSLGMLEQTPNLEVLSFCRQLGIGNDRTPRCHEKPSYSEDRSPYNQLGSPSLHHCAGSKNIATWIFVGSKCAAFLDLSFIVYSSSNAPVRSNGEGNKFSDVWAGRFSNYSSNDHSELEDQYCLSVFGFLRQRGHLPALKSLSFVDFPMAIDAARLTPMLNSRRQSCGVANLESFKLVFKRPAQQGYEEAHVSELRALVDRGFNIHIEWPADQTSRNVNPEMSLYNVSSKKNGIKAKRKRQAWDGATQRSAGGTGTKSPRRDKKNGAR
ncbi:hypothetical protein C8J57DRAFT_1470904 [Mycena rebaudengoi]|nr:hypothetical protein C8J57DRAFT_1470904 [Mycena rebaudengoi]